MTHCAGIDGSKQSLEVWDGTHEDEVPNERRVDNPEEAPQEEVWYRLEQGKDHP